MAHYMIFKSRYIILSLFLYSLHPFYTQAQSQTEKPWAFWWWMGSAVSKEDITWQLENFSTAGIGGVHIIPIYGVTGYEKKLIPYLSKEWMEMLGFTVSEGKRLGLGVDMTTGTGWPFGGKQITPDIAAKKFRISDGKFFTEPTNQKVKRAAPGGEGLVLDHFSKVAIQRYLQTFDSAFANQDLRPRAMYNDSYEVYGANWTNTFLDEFKKRRGYDLQTQILAFTDTSNQVNSALVKMDYHQTLSELLYENFTAGWTQWSKSKKFITRNQAHGSPGNILDLYALADIPETESFGTSRFSIPGLRIEENYEPERFGTPNPLAMKFASSAAHVAGKKLVSSETATWLGDHFKVSLSQVKPQVDELFTAGINHVFYHGITFSPKDEPYPGWLFYASTNFGIHSHFWKQLPLLNQYIARCQHLLQNSEPDNDLLVYFPIQDLWAQSGNIQLLDVHHTEKWLMASPFGKLCHQLQQEGFTFDYISDRWLAQLVVNKSGELNTGSVSYKALLIPSAKYLPENTLKSLLQLAEKGAQIIFTGQIPQAVTGFYDHGIRNEKFNKDIKKLQSHTKNVFANTKLNEILKRFSILPENFSGNGLSFIRKKYNGKTIYFIANLDDQFKEGWIELSTLIGSMQVYDPLTDSTRVLPNRQSRNKRTEVYVSLLPGQSCFLIGNDEATKSENFNPKPFKSLELSGNWKINFVEGKPKLPSPATLPKLSSWTTLPDSAAYFSGTASYSLVFDLPDSALRKNKYIIDLGDVRESATVLLNGKNIGTAWCIPFQLEIDKSMLKEKNNELKIAVTNLAANYMRLRDKKLPEWKKFYEINFVDIKYRPFDASNWQAMPSGLLTEIKILYK